MKSFKKMASLLGVATFIALSFNLETEAQVSFGADIANRYVWRGIDFGQSVSIQPSVGYASGSFEIGAWGAYANSGAAANELDLYFAYSFDLNENSSISIGATDYYFPAAPGQFLTFDIDGNHVVEPFIGYSGAFSVSAFINALNDPDNSVYLNAAFPFSVDEVDVEVFLGIVPMESAWYGTSGAAVQEIGLSASKELTITPEFSLPLFTSYIINPYQEVSFLLFGFSL